MPKTNIDTILKKGVKAKVKKIDYSTPEKKVELSDLRLQSETALRNYRYTNNQKYS